MNVDWISMTAIKTLNVSTLMDRLNVLVWKASLVTERNVKV